ncbi:MAG: hypothetical protein RIT02_359 [Planctomycetota bacterium]|jgi:hypothetical protein
MRRRNIQRAGRSVVGTTADSVEVRVLLSADPAMAFAVTDAVAAEVPAVELPQVCTEVDGSPVEVVACDFGPEDLGIAGEEPLVVVCEPFDPDYVPLPLEWQEGSTIADTDTQWPTEPGRLDEFTAFEAATGAVETTEQYEIAAVDGQPAPWLLAAGTGMVDNVADGRLGQVVQIINPVAFVSGSVTAEIELASASEYDSDGNLQTPAVLHDRLSGIRYWQPKQVTLQSSSDLTELLQNYGITDYSVDDQGVWQIPMSAEYGLELFNLASNLRVDDTVQAQVLLQPVDGQDATPLLISLPESQVSLIYESTWTDSFWRTDGWETSSVQVQASGAFTGTLEVSEGPLWDDAGQLVSAGILLDLATGLRYQSPQVLTISGAAIDQLDQLLQDSQWVAGLDTKILSVQVVDGQTRQLQNAPGTGYDALQLAGRLTEQTGLTCVVRLEAVDEGGMGLEISTADTVLSVIYPVSMYARGSVNLETPEVQFGDVLTAMVDGPVQPVFALGGGMLVNDGWRGDAVPLQFSEGVVQATRVTEREIVREAIGQLWMARARQPMTEVVRDVSTVEATDNTLSRVSGIAAAVTVAAGRQLRQRDSIPQQTDEGSVLQFSSMNLTSEIPVQPAETVPDLELLNPALRRRQPRPTPPQPQQGDVPVEVPVEQPVGPAAPQAENPAAQVRPVEIPVSQADSASGATGV